MLPSWARCSVSKGNRLSMETTKPCTQCHAEKELDQFYRHGNMYRKRQYMSMCKVCYMFNLHETHHLQEERQRQWEEEQRQQEQERERRKQEAEQRQKEASLQANKRCPRCNAIRDDGSLWPDGHLYFSRYCEQCMNATPHSIYTLTCPMLGVVRYVGITTQSLNKRLQQHMDPGKTGIEYKQYWIGDLRSKGVRPLIALIDEASNEREAKSKETRYIYHYLQQGCPLVNGEVMDSQIVLDVQNSTINFLEASKEDVDQTFHRANLADLMTSQWSELDYQRQYRSVSSQKQRWVNRHKCVYIIYNVKPITLQWAGRGISMDTLRREWRLRYDRVLTSDELPSDKEAREASLQNITEVLFYTEGDRILNEIIAHDCLFLLTKGIPLTSQQYDAQSFHTAYGTLVELSSPKRASGRGNSPEYLYGKAIMHPRSYTISPERSLVGA